MYPNLLPQTCRSSRCTPHALACLQVRLGPNGVEEILPLGELSEYEKEGLEKMKGLLTTNIQAGIDFANK